MTQGTHPRDLPERDRVGQRRLRRGGRGPALLQRVRSAVERIAGPPQLAVMLPEPALLRHASRLAVSRATQRGDPALATGRGTAVIARCRHEARRGRAVGRPARRGRAIGRSTVGVPLSRRRHVGRRRLRRLLEDHRRDRTSVYLLATIRFGIAAVAMLPWTFPRGGLAARARAGADTRRRVRVRQRPVLDLHAVWRGTDVGDRRGPHHEHAARGGGRVLARRVARAIWTAVRRSRWCSRSSASSSLTIGRSSGVTSGVDGASPFDVADCRQRIHGRCRLLRGHLRRARQTPDERGDRTDADLRVDQHRRPRC